MLKTSHTLGLMNNQHIINFRPNLNLTLKQTNQLWEDHSNLKAPAKHDPTLHPK